MLYGSDSGTTEMNLVREGVLALTLSSGKRVDAISMHNQKQKRKKKILGPGHDSSNPAVSRTIRGFQDELSALF